MADYTPDRIEAAFIPAQGSGGSYFFDPYPQYATDAEVATAVGQASVSDAAIASIVSSGASTRSALNATYRRVFAVKAPTGVAATDGPAIRAAIAAASAAGGGLVTLAAGTYVLDAPLPWTPGVWIEGTPPIIANPVNTSGIWMADAEMNFVGGTILKGDQTFACFDANSTDQGSVPDQIGLTQITNVGLTNVAIDGFTYGLRAGAVNIMGLVWGAIDKIYIKNCTAWAVYLANFQHVQIGEIRSCLSQNGQYYAALLPAATFMPGNSEIGELHHVVPRDGRDNRLCRGIVFEAGGTNATLNELVLRRVQCNAFNRSLLSVSASLTSGSTSITVPDGTKFAVGMPVVPTTTVGGLTASYTYVVQSISGNTLTLGASRTTAAISATATASVTLTSYGFANIEITARNSGAKVQNLRVVQMDSEGTSSAGVYMENATACSLEFFDLPGTTLTHLVGRSLSFSSLTSLNAASTDFDANSTTSAFWGTRGPIVQRAMRGMWRSTALSTTVLQVASGATGDGGDLQARIGNFLYPSGSGIGEHLTARDSAITLAGAQCGDIVFAGGSATTFTLPTIVTDTSPSASHIGMWFEVYNVSAVTLTVATDGTQTLNKVSGKTSVAVAAGSSLKVIACKDASGNLFWAAKATTLVA